MFIKILMLIVFHLKGFTIDSVVSATSESSFLSFENWTAHYHYREYPNHHIRHLENPTKLSRAPLSRHTNVRIKNKKEYIMPFHFLNLIHPLYKEKKSQHCWLLYLLFFIDFLNVLLQSHSHGWGLRIGCLNV